jgi:GTP-binding protein HflX
LFVLAALAEQALLVYVNSPHEQRNDNLQELTILVASANIDAMFVIIADCRVPGVRLFVG